DDQIEKDVINHFKNLGNPELESLKWAARSGLATGAGDPSLAPKGLPPIVDQVAPPSVRDFLGTLFSTDKTMSTSERLSSAWETLKNLPGAARDSFMQTSRDNPEVVW